MKKTIDVYICDICGKEDDDTKKINYPVLFTTEQTEGRTVEPYISNWEIDVCKNCMNKIIKVKARGAQGHNEYMEIKGDVK